MRAFKLNGRKFRLLLAAILCTIVIPFRSLADDKETSNPSAKSALAKPDSPIPLTERERWMLDRMEQLEKRVAELESKAISRWLRPPQRAAQTFQPWPRQMEPIRVSCR